MGHILHYDIPGSNEVMSYCQLFTALLIHVVTGRRYIKTSENAAKKDDFLIINTEGATGWDRSVTHPLLNNSAKRL